MEGSEHPDGTAGVGEGEKSGLKAGEQDILPKDRAQTLPLRNPRPQDTGGQTLVLEVSLGQEVGSQGVKRKEFWVRESGGYMDWRRGSPGADLVGVGRSTDLGRQRASVGRKL